jgi:hypothetical protein
LREFVIFVTEHCYTNYYTFLVYAACLYSLCFYSVGHEIWTWDYRLLLMDKSSLYMSVYDFYLWWNLKQKIEFYFNTEYLHQYKICFNDGYFFRQLLLHHMHKMDQSNKSFDCEQNCNMIVWKRCDFGMWEIHFNTDF